MAKTAEGKLRLKAVDNMSRVIDKVTQKVPRLTKNVKKMSTAWKLAQRRTESFAKTSKKVGRGMKNAGGAMTKGITAPVAAFGALTVRTAVNFEKSMNKVSALTGSTGKDLESMRKLAMQLGSSTAFSASEAADAMAFFGQAGFDANEILSATPATLSLAAAAGHDLAGTADILSNIMGGFGIAARDAGKAADVLAFTAAKGNVNLEMLGETFKDAGPAAFAAGNSFNTVAAMAAKLGDAGIQGSKAGTTLKQMFNVLSGPTTRVKKILSELGVNAVDPVTGKLRDMSHILVDLNKGFQSKGITGAKKLAVLNEVFGARAVAGSAVLLDAVTKLDPATGKAVNTVEELAKAMDKKGAGAAKRMADTMQKGLGGAFTSLGSAFEGVQLAIMELDFGGKTLQQRVVDLVGKITKFFQSLSTTNKSLLKTIVAIAGVLAVVGPMLVAFGGFLTVLPFMVTGFKTMVMLFGMLKLAAAGALVPLLPYIAAIGLLATAAYMVYKEWKPIKQFFIDFFNDPLEQVKELFKWIGKISGISSLLGLGGNDVDEQLKSQGFKIQEQGQATGAKRALEKSTENKKRDQKAFLDVKFSNMPKGTVVAAEDRESLIGNLTGDMAL
tara:strand:- start:31668 stop:33506 length:1839 start_codon:yes stop_codon:yes gene_type:complete